MERRKDGARSAVAVIAGAALSLLAGIGPAASAAGTPDRQALEGLDAISIIANAGAQAPPECGATAVLVRSAVASRTGPAGLKTVDGAPLVATAQLATLYFDKSQICVSSVTLRVGLFAFYHTDAAPKTERLGEVALVNKSGMLTSDAAAHPQRVTALVQRLLDEFVLDWREANLVAQLTKVGPAAAPPPDTQRMLVAQRRLQSLGLYAGALDGIMGERTGTAIAAFQKTRGLPVTGRLDDPTFLALSE